jgi:FkbH-like protein
MWNQRWMDPARRTGQAPDSLLSTLVAALEVFERQGSGIMVVNDLVLPRRSTEGVNAFRGAAGFAQQIAETNEQLRQHLASRSTSFLFPLSDLVAQVGRDQGFNWRTHYRGHVTWGDALMAAAARKYVGFALAVTGKATKCVVLDLDNTLWGGVLGEEGAAGIALGPDWPGREFLDFQRALLDLQRQGILLAINSKNNEDEALAVLRSHSHMVLRPEYLAAYRINWQDKAANLRELAAELNIGLDHMLFIDDSPHEREWVRKQLPELLVPDVPADPALYADWLGSLPSLIVLQRTEEDLQRTDQYQQRRTREEFRQATGSMEDFLRGLDLRVDIAAVDDKTMGRVVQLLAKTNQYNLTTRRHDEATLRRQMQTGGWRVYTMRVADRFGDFGLTGIAIVAARDTTWHLESFLMSCRVIGKSVESALLALIARNARAAGATTLTAEYIESGRNQVAAEFLPSHGFVRQSDGTFVRSLETPGPAWPEWITDGAAQTIGAGEGL